jgi:hypothetical protein
MYKQIVKPLAAIATGTTTSIGVALCLAMLATISMADSGKTNIPGIDREGVSYEVPSDLNEWSTHEVSSLLDEHQKSLATMLENQTTQADAEAHMLSELLRHDKVRLAISDVIPALIEDYKIDGEFKELLMGYRDTFKTDLLASHNEISSLGDYKAYDFRFAAVYMSMIYAFDANPEFYKQLKADMMLDDSTIGRYRIAIDDSYMSVKAASEVMESFNTVSDLENVIVALDTELNKRK